jgi:DNA-binding NtrC family response regulator
MGEIKQFTVLIVDDEEALREAIVFDFHRNGFRVFSASNGNEAFEFIQKEKIDLVISDIQMPECDGHSLLKQVRAINDDTPFIFISGGTILSQAECAKLGAQKFLAKPFDYGALQNVVCEVLGL